MDGALSRAHALDQAAHDLEAKGNLYRAIEARQRAEADFKLAAEETNDPTARATLDMLATRQQQGAEDLQRKMDKGKARMEPPRQAPGIGSRPIPRGRMAESVSTYNSSPAARRLDRVPITAHSLSMAHPAPSASTMYDSRISRRSSSPAESTMHSSPANSIFPEGSYMVLREPDPSDPFTTFNTLLEGMLQTLSNPVAFASAPIPNRSSMPPPRTRPAIPPHSSAVEPPVQDSIADSFFVVPPSAAASTSNGPRLARTTTTPASTSTRTTGKTAEELALENDSLKTALDALARQYEHIVHERAAEKEALKGSIVVFGQEVRREAERAVAAQGKPVNPPSRPTNGENSSNARMQELEAQLASTKQELLAATTAATKYKGRYDQLRDAIKKKRATRDAEAAAAAAVGSGGETSGTPSLPA